jgi:hypothetical protein
MERFGQRTFGNRWIPAAALVVSLLASGCTDREDRIRAEARSLLTMYEATSHRAPLDERERKITQLSQLAISDAPLRKTRDLCVEAHRALVRAERENDVASSQLEKALAAQNDGGPLPAEQVETIRNSIASAERAIGASRGSFEQCESEIRTLSLRYGER